MKLTTNELKNNKFIILLSVAFLLTVMLYSLFVIQRQSQETIVTTSVSDESFLETNTVEPVEVSMLLQKALDESSSTAIVDIYPNGDTNIAFYEIVLEFDPNVVNITSMDVASHWDNPIEIINEINNETGKAQLTVGKDQDAQSGTNEDPLASINIQRVGEGEATLTLLESSNAASPGSETLIPVVSQTIFLE